MRACVVQPRFERWGKHYVRALLRAHQLQVLGSPVGYLWATCGLDWAGQQYSSSAVQTVCKSYTVWPTLTRSRYGQMCTNFMDGGLKAYSHGVLFQQVQRALSSPH